MRREEKNMQSRRRILDNALEEFAERGYGLSSVNTICSAGGISKGILYHYFKDKDEVYLACVEECFNALTACLRGRVRAEGEDARDWLSNYFDARVTFFKDNPLYQRIFCEVVTLPPAHLESAIKALKAEFDALNLKELNALLERVALRPDVTREEVVETFRLYQDFINARHRWDGAGEREADLREKSCSRALSILLYGVVARGQELI